MSGELSIFTNEEFGEVRGIEVNGDAWLVGEDVINRLKYDTSKNSYSKYIKRYCDEEDFVLYDAKTQVQNGLQFDYKELGQRGGYLINESGMYSLVFGSKLPSAKKFKHWVTSEVLPSIRKHGAYMTENTIEKALTDPDFLIQLATQLKEEREQKKKLEVMNAAKDQVICELKPKADYTDEILKCPGTVTITQIAKDYGMSGTKMNKILNELGVQFKKSGQWFIYEKYNGKGYTKSQTVQIERHGVKDCVMNTKWTQKGRLFLYELLKNNGIYPNIEKVDLLG